MKNNVIVKALVLVVTVIALGTTATFAYFQATINNVETSSTINITGATLSLTYNKGDKTITGNNILPGWADTKNFSVAMTNETGKSISYDFYLNVQESNFYTSTSDIDGLGSSYLEYQLYKTCTSAYSCSDTQTAALVSINKNSSGDKKLLIGNDSNNGSTTKYYQLKLSFPNLSKAQKQTGTDNNALKFQGYVTVESTANITANS